MKNKAKIFEDLKQSMREWILSDEGGQAVDCFFVQDSAELMARAAFQVVETLYKFEREAKSEGWLND
jgi:hypothetical protein